jgi:hypothetical protein
MAWHDLINIEIMLNEYPLIRDFLKKGVEADLRGDGRNRLDARPSFLSLGVLAQASGSCRLAVYNGCTILVGVRVQVEETAGSSGDPSEEIAEETDEEGSLGGGRITCSVDWYAVLVYGFCEAKTVQLSICGKAIGTRCNIGVLRVPYSYSEWAAGWH